MLIMNIIVQLDDGILADVETQKIGHAFPCQRSTCYSAYPLAAQQFFHEFCDAFKFIITHVIGPMTIPAPKSSGLSSR